MHHDITTARAAKDKSYSILGDTLYLRQYKYEDTEELVAVVDKPADDKHRHSDDVCIRQTHDE